MEYIQALGLINERLASMADEVVEVVVGIPLLIKGGKQNENHKSMHYCIFHVFQDSHAAVCMEG